MTGEEIGREQKAKRLARAFLGALLGTLRKDESVWHEAAESAGVKDPGEQTKARVIEILEGVAI